MSDATGVQATDVSTRRQLVQDDFAGDAAIIAPTLIGATLLVNGVGGVIVEVEAYDQTEPGSHCHGGPTPRNRVMFGPPGHAYVYLTYGIHLCLNFVCREAGRGAGILIRALQPTQGLEQMRARRGMDNEHLLCAGPGRVGEALDITMDLYGLALDAPPFVIWERNPDARIRVACGPRIGVHKTPGLPWRFGLAGSRYVSKRFPD